MIGFAVELFLRGGLLCLSAALLLLLLRRAAAAYRHLVCVVALCSLPALPLLQRLLPPVELPTTVAASLAGSVSMPAGPGVSEGAVLSDPLPAAETSSPATLQRSLPPMPLANRIPHARSASARPYLAMGLTAAWGIGASLLLIRLGAALARLRRLETGSRRERLGEVSVLVSDRVETPLTWGILKSVILLPAALVSGDPAACESALRHEQAHIARWDWAWSLLAEIVCALCWFQPGAWWLRRRMRAESERACDDRVLLSGVAGPDYAAHLVEMLRAVRTNEIAPAMAQRGGMEERMRHILDAARPRHASARWLALTAPLALGLLSLAALRVSARPAQPKQPTGQAPATPIPEKPAARGTQAVGAAGNPDASADVGPEIKAENIVWTKGKDGLDAGFVVVSPDLPKNRQVALNTRLEYRVLVRNAGNREAYLYFYLGKANPWDFAASFVPEGDLREALRSQNALEQFKVVAVTPLSAGLPSYQVKLNPGEAAVVPQELSLTIGDADPQAFPRTREAKPGKNWIVQPVMARHLNADEAVWTERYLNTPYSTKRTTTIVDRNGKTSRRIVAVAGAGTGTIQLYPRFQIEVPAKSL